jgi:hypothetical protein
MAKLLTLNQKELIAMVKTIVEQVDVDFSQYDDNDFFDAFVYIFRNWLNNKLGEESKKYPFSYLLNKYGQEFVKEGLGDNYSRYFGNDKISFSSYQIPRITQYLIKHGVHSLPTLRQEEKFTEKYAKQIPRLIKHLLKIPSYVKLVITEDRPYEITIAARIDYPSYLKSEEPFYRENILQKELGKIFQDYMGIELGNPSHGQLRLTSYSVLDNEDEWIKNVLNKQIKKGIKELPGGKYVHSIKFQPKVHLNSELKIVFNKSLPSLIKKYEFKNSALKYIKDLGYTKIDVDYL